MILLWGPADERPLAAVWKALKRAGADTTLLDQRSVLDTRAELRVGTTIEGFVQTSTTEINLSKVTAGYLRPYDCRVLPEVVKKGRCSPNSEHAEAVEDILSSWAEMTSALIVNRLAAMASNSSKPYQSRLIQSAGFRIPETLITTDPDAAREFWRRHGAVIYKSLSGVRSVVSKLRLEHERRLEDIRWCPTQFQQYLSGIDYRVHVVGSEVIASEVESKAVDYRYPESGQSVRIRPYSLPDEIADRYRRLAASMGLIVAGIDLRRTAENTWYCFEVNTSPGFTYFQDQTGQPIAEAIAHLLIRAGNRG